MKYIQAINTGKGFITKEDRLLGHISGHGLNIYSVSDEHTNWIIKVNGLEKTKEEAEAILLQDAQTGWDNNNLPNETTEDKQKRLGGRPNSISLP